jgi:formyltetrahydrofolate deformylase
MSRAPDTWILTADCPSVLGTVDAVTRFLFEQGCYVTEHHSFDDRLSGRFFIRVEFRQPDGFDDSPSAPASPSVVRRLAWSSS